MTDRPDVLVVEDELVVLNAACKILRQEGLTVATANRFDEAVAILNAEPCRLILTDLMLPGASGFELLGLAKKRWPSTEIIVITGYPTLDHVLTTFRSGAFDFLPKPFDVGELLGVVRRALRLSPGTSRRQIGNPSENTALFLGRHAWAELQIDGSATLGVAESFPNLLGSVQTIELPATGEHRAQGQLLARILAADEVVYRIWSPLSGTVLAVNPEISDSADLIDRDPFGAGWLIRAIPDNLDHELAFLDRRRFHME